MSGVTDTDRALLGGGGATRTVRVAATQMRCGADTAANLARAEAAVRRAAAEGAHIVLLQELFATPYFCKDEEEVGGVRARLARLIWQCTRPGSTRGVTQEFTVCSNWGAPGRPRRDATHCHPPPTHAARVRCTRSMPSAGVL